MPEEDTKQKQLALTIARGATAVEADALRDWAWKLLQIREEKLSVVGKAKRAVTLTASSNVIFPAVKIVAMQSKKHGWDNRSPAQKVGLGAAGIAVALFGGAQAGIAALGGAIGVPLWVVLGGGSMFAKYLFDELTQKADKPTADLEEERISSPTSSSSSRY